MLSTYTYYAANIIGLIKSEAANKINVMSSEGDELFDKYLTTRCPVLRDSFYTYYISNLLWWRIVSPISTLIEYNECSTNNA